MKYFVHYELLEQERFITADVYRKANEGLQRKCPAFLKRRGVIRQYDNRRAQFAKQNQ